jgi:hypothetical protein
MDFKIILKVLIDSLKIDLIDLPKCDVLTFACDNDRYINYNGKMYSPLINTIEDELKERNLFSVSITRIASTIKGELSHGFVYSPEGKFSRAMICKRIKAIFLPKNKYSFSWMEVKVWEEILNQTCPKAVVAILPSRELCYVCRQRGIWVCDVQHGVIANEHYWYGAQFRENDPREWLPNSFLVWDSGSHDVINIWAEKKNIETVIIGNPWVDRFRKSHDRDEIVKYLKNYYEINNDKRKTILLTLSWGGHGLENRFIHESLEKFIKDTSDKYCWKIRLHPNQVRGFASDEGREFLKYFDENFKGMNIEWRAATEMPLPLLLSLVDLHVTWLSSVCMEAAYFGIPSLVLCPKLQKGGSFESYYEYLVKLGYVEKLIPNYDLINDWFEGRGDVKMACLGDYSETFNKVIDQIKIISIK